MSAPTLAAMSPTIFFVSQLIAFVLLAAVLWRFVGPALSAMLSARSREIEQTFAKIESETAETTRQLAEIRKQLAETDLESQRRLEAALDEANRARTQSLSEANSQAVALGEKARREIAIERDKAVLELRQETTRLTLEAAERLVKSRMDDPTQERLVQKYLANLDAVKKS